MKDWRPVSLMKALRAAFSDCLSRGDMPNAETPT